MQMAITITPNPASSKVTIYSTTPVLDIMLYDANGRKLVSQRLTNGIMQMDISKFSKGIYTLVAQSNGKIIESNKIVKQ